MLALRERLQSGDVWVDGSRAFRAFDDFLLPRDAFANRRKAGELGLAVTDRFEDWRDEKTKRLETRLREVDALAAAGDLPEASLTEEGLSISPIRKSENEAAVTIIRRLYAMLPHLRITELFAEVHGQGSNWRPPERRPPRQTSCCIRRRRTSWRRSHELAHS